MVEAWQLLKGADLSSKVNCSTTGPLMWAMLDCSTCEAENITNRSYIRSVKQVSLAETKIMSKYEGSMKQMGHWISMNRVRPK
ncbi:hypothetical protein Ahy_A01g001455 isoform A [Arachis hypogaea]|uniref:Uncharacterized protein n=1 Tax=Arachis hypogaea TaxID=3818 RepID=A0A445END4_ARAHY|nr:hypothetical protein Ahy_A01g001455 isoform A [Arachis hypogaea]